MNLEVVPYDRDYTSEAFVKVSSRSNITNPVKTPPVLQVSPGVLEEVEVLDEHGGGDI